MHGSSPRVLGGLSEAIEHYDALILDLWGVIHDGLALYPGVAECLANARAAGKKIVFLSNAPRRASRAVEILTGLGVHPGGYDAMLTSGEVTYEYFVARTDPFFAALGPTYLYMGLERDAELIEGLGYTRVADPKDAAFILNTGTDDFSQWPEEKRPVLEASRKFDLPMVCPNPDDIVVRQDGTKIPCAGLLGQLYEELGGTVRYIGKPYGEVYARCMEVVGSRKALAVGDNLDTDILGANRAGLDVALVTGGILKIKLGLKDGEVPAPATLEPLYAETAARPSYVMAGFRW